MFKVELENRDFRKSLYFNMVYAEKKRRKKNKKNKRKKEKKNNGLRLGAGIILNQELTYSKHWGKMGCGRLPAP